MAPRLKCEQCDTVSDIESCKQKDYHNIGFLSCPRCGSLHLDWVKDMKNVEKYEHWDGYDPVWVMSELKGKHREHCLCHQGCKKFKPGEEDNCPIAQENFEFCVKHGVVSPMWECPKFER